MSVLLADDLDLNCLGLQPGQHEHLIIEEVSEKEFVAKVKDTNFTSFIGSSAKATYLAEILGREVPLTPRNSSWMPMLLTTDDVLYVAAFTTSRNLGEPGLREIREARKTYYRVLIDPLGCAIVMVSDSFVRPSVN
jgi:hypothetical protein